MRKTSQRVFQDEEGVDTNGSLMVDTAEGQVLYPFKEGDSTHSNCQRKKPADLANAGFWGLIHVL